MPLTPFIYTSFLLTLMGFHCDLAHWYPDVLTNGDFFSVVEKIECTRNFFKSFSQVYTKTLKRWN